VPWAAARPTTSSNEPVTTRIRLSRFVRIATTLSVPCER
jgi:hypothetical protein